MPGVDLNLDLPGLSDTLSTVVSKVSTALSAIAADLADKVVSSEITLDADLPLNEHPLVSVGSLQFVPSTVTPEGSVFYGVDGEFRLITGATTVKLTDGSGLNIAAVAGFTGDYGDGNESAAYNASANEFIFTEDVGVPADLVADDIVLQGSSGSVRIGVADSITGNETVNVATLPSSGATALVYDSADSGVKDNADARATATLLATNIDYTGAIIRGDAEVSRGFQPYVVESVGLSLAHVVASDIPRLQGQDSVVYFQLAVPVGHRLKTVEVVISNVSTWTTSNVGLRRYTRFPAAGTTIAYTLEQAVDTQRKLTCTVTSPTALQAGQQLFLKLTWPGIESVYHITYTHDRVA